MLKDQGRRRYALCAIDALGVGPLLRTAVIAHSECLHCGRSIRVHVEGNQIAAAEPPGTVVWYGRPELLTKRESNLNLAEAH